MNWGSKVGNNMWKHIILLRTGGAKIFMRKILNENLHAS